MSRTILKFTICALLLGCQSLPYQDLAQSKSEVGYEEQKIDDSTFQVSYYGKKDSPYEVLRSYLAIRASELCKGDFEIRQIKQMVSVSAHRKPFERRFIQGTVACLRKKN